MNSKTFRYDERRTPLSIRTVVQSAADAWNKGDLAKFCSYYHPNASLVVPTGRISGRDDILSYYRSAYSEKSMGHFSVVAIECPPRLVGETEDGILAALVSWEIISCDLAADREKKNQGRASWFFIGTSFFTMLRLDIDSIAHLSVQRKNIAGRSKISHTRSMKIVARCATCRKVLAMGNVLTN